VLKEPHGGAHRDPQAMAEVVKQSMVKHLAELSQSTRHAIAGCAAGTLAQFGVFREADSA
jgi:acetyl-CoA carboxylase carboxyl transferase subunit alpha